MGLHTAQDIVEEPHRSNHMGPLLNITHSALCPMAASVISAREGTPLWKVSGLASPKRLACEQLHRIQGILLMSGSQGRSVIGRQSS
jgi:hypothetical protein